LSMNKTKAIYAASLDPITFGHLWVIRQGLELFDELVVCIAVNPSKVGRYLFSAEERASMAIASVPAGALVKTIGPNYLVDFIRQERATHLLRGVRNAEDFSVEQTMAEVNRQMANNRGFDIETIMVTPPHELSIVSSSFVKSLIGYEGWQKEIRQYVPEQIAEALEAKYIK